MQSLNRVTTSSHLCREFCGNDGYVEMRSQGQLIYSNSSEDKALTETLAECTYTYNPSADEVEAGGSEFKGHPPLHREFEPAWAERLSQN